ncbi:MAG: hypothetical protein CFE35_00500 [Novosphingobium sp. PASSN1]|nr:MAG: hypothetical protein CFE35_00500 [Novosphingobium sp. PASSN1]
MIFGSCVSRDPFNRVGPDNPEFALVDYFARSSMASIGLAPLKGVDVSSIRSPFQRRMVDRDLRKKFLPAVKSLEYDVLLVDFIDDRFKLIVTNRGQGITDSTAFRELTFDLATLRFKKLSNRDDLFRDHWKKGWQDFLATAGECGATRKILINRVYWSASDDEGNPFPDQQAITDANAYLDWVYDQIAQDLPTEQFLEYPRAGFIGKCQHQWGRSPFHYVDAVEEHCLRGVSAHQLMIGA